MTSKKTIGILTSGGDSPGMNAAIASIVRFATQQNMDVIGIQRGYNGVLMRGKSEKENYIRLSMDIVRRTANLPGTMLFTARCEEFVEEKYQMQGAENLKRMNMDGLIVIGGDGSFKGARALSKLGIPCIGIPGTIDNDLPYTQMTLGFDTAVNSCVEDIRSIRSTSRSHERPAVAEVMGRYCGNIALKAAQASDAEILIVPEVPWSIDEVASKMQAQLDMGNLYPTVVIAEGAYDAMAPFDMYGFLTAHGKEVYKGEPMSALRLASVLKRKCGGAEVRSTVLGYTQRGRQPSAYDAAFAFDAGHLAVDLLAMGKSKCVIGIENGILFHKDIDEALKCTRAFDKKLYDQVNATAVTGA